MICFFSNFSEEANIELRENLRDHEQIIIHPLSIFRSCWDIGNLIFLLIILWILPMQIFGIMAPNSEPDFIKIINLVTDLWFVVDVYLNFRTCILRGKGTKQICHPAKIRMGYFNSRWFAIDLVSSIPVDIILRLFITDANQNIGLIQNLKSVKIIRLIRVLKLLRIGRIIKNAGFWEKMNLVSHDVDFLTHILKMIFGLIMIIHMNACILYGVPYITIEFYDLEPPDYNFKVDQNATTIDPSVMTTMKDSWIVLRGLIDLPKENITERWLWSLMKSISHMICIGYGQFPPLNKLDTWASIITILIGQVIFAIFLGLIITAMHQKQVTRIIYQQKQAELNDYMSFRKLPPALRRSIGEYFEARYEGCVFNEETIIKMLNPGLQKVVIETSKSWHLQSSNCPIGFCSEEFIQECSNLMKSETYLTNDIIIKPNAFVRDVIFIDKGFIGEYKNHSRIYNYMKGMGIFKELLPETIYMKDMFEKGQPEKNEKSNNDSKNEKSNIDRAVADSKESRFSQTPYYTSSTADADYIFRVDRMTYFVCETTVNVYELDLYKFMNVVKKYPKDRETILKWYEAQIN